MINLNLKSLVAKLNPTLRNSLEGGAGLCMSRGQYNVEIEHWLIKLLDENDIDLHLMLKQHEIDLSRLMKELVESIDRFKSGNTRAPALATSIVDLAKNTWMLATIEFGHSNATSAHFFAALMLDDTTRRQIQESSQELKKVKLELLNKSLYEAVGSTSESKSSGKGQQQSSAASANTGDSALDKYTVNLTERALNGELDPVLGRDEEIRQCIDILTRRRQNNPILTGEAGVGKTAVVEGFALRIAQDDVPEILKQVNVRTLDLGLLQAGASVKGEFENRLKSVISEVKASPVPIILFIDEAHTLIGAGGKEGQGDAANLLKPALARGELRTIAATTWAEYKKYFERDPALTRRFQVVKIEEPVESKAIDMMRAISKSLQKHHKVRILDEAIIASVQLSSRYIPGRQLPDKSVSLLDTACARIGLSQTSTPASIEDATRRIEQLISNQQMLEKENAATGDCDEQLGKIAEEMKEVEKELKVLKEQWEKEKVLVADISSLSADIENSISPDGGGGISDVEDPEVNTEGKEGEGNVNEEFDLEKSRHLLRDKLSELEKIQDNNGLILPFVNEQAVAEVVANWTGIPVGKMVADEITSILHLSEQLSKRVIGQKHALDAISESIQTSRAGLADPRKPVGVFLMAGTSGVGKTETALAVAEQLFGGENNITVINMSEFKEEHKVSMLLGSPPGYVGYGEGGVLTEAVRRKPYSVVLLDEMEKAHPGIQDVFYNVFDKGTIKDGEGRDIDFKNTVIIMTSNAGEDAIREVMSQQENKPEPEELLKQIRPALLEHFKPAFLGRVKLLSFYPLEDSELKKITALNFNKIKKRVLETYNAEFSYDEAVLDHIVDRCQESDTGARNIENIITGTLLPELASECLSKMAEGKEIEKVEIGISDKGAFSYLLS